MSDTSTAAPAQNELQRRFVIGTAGHVDHGKSTLVRALTGINPDRLIEEQQRELTIDLGFAWFTLPGGREVSVIDVPGHEKFVGNMLAGIGGIDIALLVIAADDGPMPQTREHLAILDLLDVRHGVVALSRSDLVDEEWRDLVSEEVRELLHPTSLAGAAIVPVSSITGAGLDELKRAIDAVLDGATPRDSGGRPRLPVDRAFPVSGFGAVVTGTLIDGEIAVGQEMVVYPAGHQVRVRGLQEHQQEQSRVDAGRRVAVNLAGIDVNNLHRGDVLAQPGTLTPSLRLDCRIRLLPDVPQPMKHNDEVVVFTGSSETLARAALLNRDEVPPGDQAWIQLRLKEPVAVRRGDHVILRRPSPAATIGGGVIVDPAPPRHKRNQEAVIQSLEVLAQGSPEDLILQQLGDGIIEVRELAASSGVPDILERLPAMVTAGEITPLLRHLDQEIVPKTMLVRQAVFERLTSRVKELLTTQHEQHPLNEGMRRDEMIATLGIKAPKAFDALVSALERAGVVRSNATVIASPDFEISLTAEQQLLADSFLAAARKEPYAPPAPDALGLPKVLVGAMAALHQVERISDQIVYPAEVFHTILDGVIAWLDAHGEITLAEYRDLFETSRKYAQPTLEHLDELRVTRRMGDKRVRFVGAGALRGERR